MKLSAGQQQHAADEARERKRGKKGDIQRIYGNEEWRGALTEAQALEQSGVCVFGRGVNPGWENNVKTTASPVNRCRVFLDWAGEGSGFTGIREQH